METILKYPAEQSYGMGESPRRLLCLHSQHRGREWLECTGLQEFPGGRYIVRLFLAVCSQLMQVRAASRLLKPASEPELKWRIKEQ